MERRMILAAGAVHVWPASLDLGAARAAACARVLSPDERARADAFRYDRDRQRFIVTRALLRMLLGACLGAAPEEVALVAHPAGKPRLAGRQAASGLRFSLAHAGGVALFAFARDREVGVDLERVDPAVAWPEVAAAFFSRAEVGRIDTLPPAEGARGFFRHWTRWEAWAKATGKGLGALDARDALPPWGDLPARPDGVAFADGPRRWSLVDLDDVVPDHAAALVVEGEGAQRPAIGPDVSRHVPSPMWATLALPGPPLNRQDARIALSATGGIG
jgi:4'-phosphopantetheinyl transferase